MAAAQGASKTIIRRLPPALKSLVGVNTSTIHLTGVTFKGPVGLVRGPFGSWPGFKKIYGGLITTSYLPITVWAIMRAPRGLKRVFITRITHYTDPDDYTTTIAVAGTANLSGNVVVATAGAETGTVAGPWNLDAGQTLDIHCDEDGSGPDTATFTATAGRLVGGAYGVVTAGDIVMKADKDPDNQTFTFSGGETVAQAAALVNDTASGFKAIVVGAATLDFESDTEGTDSRIEIVSDTTGTAVELGHTAPSVNTGTGNVGDIDAVDFTEFKTIVEAAVVNPATGVTCTEEAGGEPTITSNTTGTGSSIQIESSSTADAAFGFDNILHSGTAGSSQTVVVVDAKYPGDHTLTVDVEDPTDGESDHWKLKVHQAGELVETWDNLPADSGADSIVNNADTGSEWVTVTDQALATRPDNVTGSAIAGGDDGLTGLVDADYIGDAGSRSTRLLADYIALRAIPGWATAVVQPDLVNWSESTNSYAVLAGALGLTVAGVRTFVKTTASLKGLSEFGGFYWPNVYLANPDEDVYGTDSDKVLMPADGAVLAAIIVQDAEPGGVHEAAGGLENGALFGVVDIETGAVNDVNERDKLYPDRINIIHQDASGEPFYIDGSRTLKSDGPFPSIGESRGVIYITESLRRHVDPKRHQNITLRKLGEIRSAGELFLRRETQQGAFFTTDPETAYYFDVSKNVNPASERAKGIVHILLGLNKPPPMEWIFLDVTKDVRALFEELGL